MPTEGMEKGKLYFKSKEDEEYKELGTGTVLEPSFTEVEEKEINELRSAAEKQFTFNIKTKKYRRKRFKKLLMSKGIQRNEAEICSRLFCKTQFELDMFFNKKLNSRR